MNFDIGDATDQALCATLVHEFGRCRESFREFTVYAGRNVMGEKSPTLLVRSHDAYGDFLRHLYEFYVGCFKRDRRNDREIRHEQLDLLFRAEVEKMLKARRNAIVGGYAPKWENDIAVYETAVPLDFGLRWRRIRNAHSHASTKRAASDASTSLKIFFKDCHLFVYLLFESAQFMWGRTNGQTDLGAIQRFDLSPT